MRLPLLPRALHQTDRPSATAQATLLFRALELNRPPDERIVSDRFAPVFLSPVGRRALAALRAGGGAVRLGERSDLGSLATSVLCRHRFIDAHLLEQLPDVEQVLVLGAGWDSRGWRFAGAIGRRPVIEVDLAPLSRAKRQVVAAHPDVFGRGHVTSVEIDFRTQTLPERLAGSGFRPGAPTFVVWEGVAMYLSAEAVADTLTTLAQLCGPGSTVAMDFYQHVRGWRPYDQVRRLGELSLGLIGEPVTFAIAPTEVGRLLGRAGLDVAELATAGTLASRFSTGGRRCDECLYVVAARF